MGLPLTDPGEVRSGCKDRRAFLHSNHTDNSDIWVGDVVCDPLHGADPGWVPPLVGETDHGKTPIAPTRRDMELHADSKIHAGSGG